MVDKGFAYKLNQLPIVNSLRGWVQLASGPAAATVIMTAVALAANVLIFRVVPPAQAGQFALLVAISQILSVLAGLGQPTLIRRNYARQPLGHFDWRQDLQKTFYLVTPLAFGASGLVAYLYQFDVNYWLIILTATLGYVGINTCSQILASQRHYISSNVILRLPNTLLLLIGALISFVGEADRLPYLLAGYLCLIGLTVFISLWLLARKVTRGPLYISWSERKQGLAFVISNLSYQWPEEGLLSLAGLFVSTSQIAAMSALALFLRPFGTMYDVLNHILLTELARRENTRHKQMWWALATLTVTMVVGAIALTPLASHWLYAGRYDAFHYLVPLLAAGSALQLIEVLPRSHVIARSSNQAVNRFIALGTLNIAVGTAVTLIFILKWEVAGLALGIILVYSVRVLISILFSRRLLTPNLSAETDKTPPTL